MSIKPVSSQNKQREFGLILIGDELMSGRRADKHFPHVVKTLASYGLTLSWMQCIGDEPERIVSTLKNAYEASQTKNMCIFSCGGIGSTPDDYTRQCAAQAFGTALEIHPEARSLILQRTMETAVEKGEAFDEESVETFNRLEMGRFPVGSTIIPNPYNKIPGFSYGDLHFFPGFPVMAWPMMEWVLNNQYANDFKHTTYVERSVLVFGIGEATLTPLMFALEEQFSGIKVFSLPSVDHPQHGAHIELGVKGDALLVDTAFERMLKELEAMVTARCGSLKRLD